MSSPASSTTSTPSKQGSVPSPTITPLHDPSQQAKIIAQKPLGAVNRLRSTANEAANPVVPGQSVNPTVAAGLGQKALLAKRFAKANKSTVSPTDQMQSPCTQKLAGARQKNFLKAKPASLAARFAAVRDSTATASTIPKRSER